MKLRLDSHVDTLHEFARRDIQDFNWRNDHNLKVNIPKLRDGGVNALFLALFTKQEWGVKGGRDRINWLLQIFREILGCEGCAEHLRHCLTPQEIYQTIDKNKIAISLGIENGIVIDDDLDMLKAYSDHGVRYLTLCHNFANQICDSSTDAPIHNGLSRFGKQLIPEMNKLGMMIDVSHASDKTVEDVLEISEKPIIASHSNARTVCDNPRNLNDDLMRKIAAKGGVIQVSALPKCVSKEEVRFVTDMVDHIGYISRLIGINHVGIGSDFDGGAKLHGFFDISQAKNITKDLEERGYTEDEIDKIWGLNFMRVYKANYEE